MADSTEHHIALREAYQIGASDSFFAARKELRDTQHERYIFDAGFRRGFDVHESLQRKEVAKQSLATIPNSHQPADAALADDSTLTGMTLDAEADATAALMETAGQNIFVARILRQCAAALRARAVPEGFVTVPIKSLDLAVLALAHAVNTHWELYRNAYDSLAASKAGAANGDE